MDPADVDPLVKDAVRAWGHAKNIEAAAKALAESRRALPSELLGQLISEVAEISAELMVELVTNTTELTEDAEPVEVLGEAMHPKQAERLGAWLEDQRLTAEALGQSGEAWMRQIEHGFERYGQRMRGETSPSAAASEASAETARRLLGNASEAFSNRPAQGQSDRAGLRGLLAIRNFSKKPKKPGSS